MFRLGTGPALRTLSMLSPLLGIEDRSLKLAEYCRAWAHDCERLADQLSFAPARAQLMDLVNRWKQLAERAERKDNGLPRSIDCQLDGALNVWTN
jgi:hypothetical protein